MALGSVAVVFGAGASFDCVDLPVEEVIAGARPPLTAQIFDPGFGQFFAPYSDASMLVSTIKTQIRDGQPLEAILRDYSQTTALHRRAQFTQLPLYLRDLFTWVSDEYTRNPTNYSHLAHELITSFDRAIFVTLNYDRLLEKVLSVPSLGGPIEGIENYDRPRWSLAKLHGSVDWVRRSLGIYAPTNLGGNSMHPFYLNSLAEFSYRHLSVDDVFGSEITFMLPGGEMMSDGYLYYPAIVAPVEGKYGFACPAAMVSGLEASLQECRHVLVIGASGKDLDLIELLQRSLGQVVNYHFVGSGPDLEAASVRFSRGVPQLRAAPMAQIHSDGFTGFLKNGFAKFISDARLLAGE